MADKSNAQKVDAQRALQDLPKTVRTSREKVTSASAAATMDTAAEWSLENAPSGTAPAHYTPAVGETRTIAVRTAPPPGSVESTIVAGMVWLAKRTRSKPGASLALAAAAGLAAGWGVRRI